MVIGARFVGKTMDRHSASTILEEERRMEEQEPLHFLDWWDDVGAKLPWMRLLGRAEKEACRQTAHTAWNKARET